MERVKQLPQGGKVPEGGEELVGLRATLFSKKCSICANLLNSGLKERLENLLLIQETFCRDAGRKALTEPKCRWSRAHPPRSSQSSHVSEVCPESEAAARFLFCFSSLPQFCTVRGSVRSLVCLSFCDVSLGNSNEEMCTIHADGKVAFGSSSAYSQCVSSPCTSSPECLIKWI